MIWFWFLNIICDNFMQIFTSLLSFCSHNSFLLNFQTFVLQSKAPSINNAKGWHKIFLYLGKFVLQLFGTRVFFLMEPKSKVRSNEQIGAFLWDISEARRNSWSNFWLILFFSQIKLLIYFSHTASLNSLLISTYSWFSKHEYKLFS